GCQVRFEHGGQGFHGLETALLAALDALNAADAQAGKARQVFLGPTALQAQFSGDDRHSRDVNETPAPWPGRSALATSAARLAATVGRLAGTTAAGQPCVAGVVHATSLPQEADSRSSVA